MEFYASLTINRCHFDRLCDIWGGQYPQDSFPFSRAIVSPLFARGGILERLHSHRKECKVIFDSGGFHIQQGRMALKAASERLRQVYEENSWAHRFALPDAPITTTDSREAISQKLRSTRRQYRHFPEGLPNSLRRKFLPVVHGTTSRELKLSALAARQVGSQSIGFGGFSTSGPNAGVNSFTFGNLRLLTEFAAICTKWNLKLHVFGIGGPAAIAVLRYTPVNSFDSAGWIRTAAYGNVYLPYVGAVNITGATSSRRFVTPSEFRKALNKTAHSCAFCDDEKLLARSWQHRALHNYCTVLDVTRELNFASAEQTLEKLRVFNPRFATYLHLVLQARSASAEDSQPRNRGRSRNNARGKTNPPTARITRTLEG